MMPKAKLRKCIRKSFRVFWWGYFFVLCINGIFFTQIGVTDSISEIITLLVTVIGTVAVFTWFSVYEDDKMGIFLMFCGYMVRVVYRYGTDFGVIILSYSSVGSDAAHFWKASSNLYFGVHNDIVLTKYPYLLKWFYEVFGNNRYLAEYVNIIFWVLSSIILIKLSRAVGLSGKKKYVLYGIWVVLPSSILIGTDLLRENIMVFFDMWSFYFFLEWMKSGKKFYCIGAFVLAAPAAYLHTASIALWAAYISILAFWNMEEKKFRFSKKTFGLLFIGFLGGECILFSPLKNIFGAYIGGEISLYAVTHRPIPKGGSDYLQWMDCQNWLQFFPYTLIRIFYFLFAPLPQEARSIIDLFSFAMDGLIVFVLLSYMWYKKRDKKKKNIIVAAHICILALSGIFAWGVQNAGTAIRHRMLVWAILIMGGCIAMGKEDLHEK